MVSVLEEEVFDLRSANVETFAAAIDRRAVRARVLAAQEQPLAEWRALAGYALPIRPVGAAPKVRSGIVVLERGQTPVTSQRASF